MLNKPTRVYGAAPSTGTMPQPQTVTAGPMRPLPGFGKSAPQGNPMLRGQMGGGIMPLLLNGLR